MPMGELKPYQKRFVIEYRELDERTRKLGDMLRKWDAGELDFTPACPRPLLDQQFETMNRYGETLQYRAEIEGIDLDTADVDYPGDMSDGYHTFSELYRYRMLYNAALFKTIRLWHAASLSGDGDAFALQTGKSKRHHDGTEPFGGGWFVVWVTLPDGSVIFNHYRMEYWGLFHADEYDTAPEWDGSTPEQEGDMLETWLRSAE